MGTASVYLLEGNHIRKDGTTFPIEVSVRLITIEMLPTDRRGTGIGFRSLIGGIGGTIGLLLSAVVILFVGLGTTFIIFVMAHLFVIPIAYFFLKETKGVELSEIK